MLVGKVAVLGRTTLCVMNEKLDQLTNVECVSIER